MSEAEKLMADVPAQDPRFVVAVMARIEQRRFHRELARTGGLAAVAMLLLALVMPSLDGLLTPLLNVSAMADFSRDYGGTIAIALIAVTLLLPRLSRG